mmetsp:Transcript_42063/g.105807  ORF Transcript_42063/g.105807 Transcript_42063/m.105807 type:complete len:221 (+) Transcript_42063:1172-1834(+)
MCKGGGCDGGFGLDAEGAEDGLRPVGAPVRNVGLEVGAAPARPTTTGGDSAEVLLARAPIGTALRAAAASTATLAGSAAALANPLSAPSFTRTTLAGPGNDRPASAATRLRKRAASLAILPGITFGPPADRGLILCITFLGFSSREGGGWDGGAGWGSAAAFSCWEAASGLGSSLRTRAPIGADVCPPSVRGIRLLPPSGIWFTEVAGSVLPLALSLSLL